MIKVIQSTTHWLPQTQTWIYNQVKNLPGDINTHIVCEKTLNYDQFYIDNIHQISKTPVLKFLSSIQKFKVSSFIRLFWLYFNFRRFKADIIHSHFGHIGWYDSLLIRWISARHVVTFYGYDVKRLPKQNKKWLKRYKSLFKNTDLVLCEGEHMARCIIKLGCPESKIKVNHLGVNTGSIPFRPRSCMPKEQLRILIAASFREKKGIPSAIEALGQFQKENNSIEKITIIGDATEEEHSKQEKRRIIHSIKRNRLSSRVKLLGFKRYDTLMKESYNHHIFLSPSITANDGDTEGGAPVTIIEMMATGMLVVSTSHCDIPGVVKYGNENWLVPENDITELSNRLKWLSENRESWEPMIFKGRNHIEKEFDTIHQSHRLAQHYKSLLK
ncbi:glycosyltransferase [Desulfoluna spongiiphila]|uniref:Colanic acid/amylovoran biosynthesis glycosyltransferase n=1 Tax=Desulfoluna spongiiphila TaxID=419481 RepID=A0A1G5JPS8_9BACT|nr:glycosyltransferase [Desulfoluna spongiiphila]SCY89911.1 colanic acid/amylovoran biosynthesis glycosyltransferase [Desulfoluna spongiiphila]